MTANKYFNINRFKNILRKELHSNLKHSVLIIGAMFSIFTIIVLLIFQFGEKPTEQNVLDKFHLFTFGIMLFVGGIFITSFSFLDLRSNTKAHFYLLTPTSAFEKFLANLLFSLVGYMIFMFVTYFAYSHIFNWIVEATYDLKFVDIDYTNKDLSIAINVFIFVHSLFFLGSAYFKKYPLILTPIATFIVVSFLIISSEILKKIIFPGVDVDTHVNSVNLEELFNFYQLIGRIVLFYILPPIFWFMTYLKLKEKEY